VLQVFDTKLSLDTDGGSGKLAARAPQPSAAVGIALPARASLPGLRTADGAQPSTPGANEPRALFVEMNVLQLQVVRFGTPETAGGAPSALLVPYRLLSMAGLDFTALFGVCNAAGLDSLGLACGALSIEVQEPMLGSFFASLGSFMNLSAGLESRTADEDHAKRKKRLQHDQQKQQHVLEQPAGSRRTSDADKQPRKEKDAAAESVLPEVTVLISSIGISFMSNLGHVAGIRIERVRLACGTAIEVSNESLVLQQTGALTCWLEWPAVSAPASLSKGASIPNAGVNPRLSSRLPPTGKRWKQQTRKAMAKVIPANKALVSMAALVFEIATYTPGDHLPIVEPHILFSIGDSDGAIAQLCPAPPAPELLAMGSRKAPPMFSADVHMGSMRAILEPADLLQLLALVESAKNIKTLLARETETSVGLVPDPLPPIPALGDALTEEAVPSVAITGGESPASSFNGEYRVSVRIASIALRADFLPTPPPALATSSAGSSSSSAAKSTASTSGRSTNAAPTVSAGSLILDGITILSFSANGFRPTTSAGAAAVSFAVASPQHQEWIELLATTPEDASARAPPALGVDALSRLHPSACIQVVFTEALDQGWERPALILSLERILLCDALYLVSAGEAIGALASFLKSASQGDELSFTATSERLFTTEALSNGAGAITTAEEPSAPLAMDLEVHVRDVSVTYRIVPASFPMNASNTAANANAAASAGAAAAASLSDSGERSGLGSGNSSTSEWDYGFVAPSDDLSLVLSLGTVSVGFLPVQDMLYVDASAITATLHDNAVLGQSTPVLVLNTVQLGYRTTVVQMPSALAQSMISDAGDSAQDALHPKASRTTTIACSVLGLHTHIPVGSIPRIIRAVNTLTKNGQADELTDSSPTPATQEAPSSVESSGSLSTEKAVAGASAGKYSVDIGDLDLNALVDSDNWERAGGIPWDKRDADAMSEGQMAEEEADFAHLLAGSDSHLRADDRAKGPGTGILSVPLSESALNFLHMSGSRTMRPEPMRESLLSDRTGESPCDTSLESPSAFSGFDYRGGGATSNSSKAPIFAGHPGQARIGVEPESLSLNDDSSMAALQALIAQSGNKAPAVDAVSVGSDHGEGRLEVETRDTSQDIGTEGMYGKPRPRVDSLIRARPLRSLLDMDTPGLLGALAEDLACRVVHPTLEGTTIGSTLSAGLGLATDFQASDDIDSATSILPPQENAAAALLDRAGVHPRPLSINVTVLLRKVHVQVDFGIFGGIEAALTDFAMSHQTVEEVDNPDADEGDLRRKRRGHGFRLTGPGSFSSGGTSQGTAISAGAFVLTERLQLGTAVSDDGSSDGADDENGIDQPPDMLGDELEGLRIMDGDSTLLREEQMRPPAVQWPAGGREQTTVLLIKDGFDVRTVSGPQMSASLLMQKPRKTADGKYVPAQYPQHLAVSLDIRPIELCIPGVILDFADASASDPRFRSIASSMVTELQEGVAAASAAHGRAGHAPASPPPPPGLFSLSVKPMSLTASFEPGDRMAVLSKEKQRITKAKNAKAKKDARGGPIPGDIDSTTSGARAVNAMAALRSGSVGAAISLIPIRGLTVHFPTIQIAAAASSAAAFKRMSAFYIDHLSSSRQQLSILASALPATLLPALSAAAQPLLGSLSGMAAAVWDRGTEVVPVVLDSFGAAASRVLRLRSAAGAGAEVEADTGPSLSTTAGAYGGAALTAARTYVAALVLFMGQQWSQLRERVLPNGGHEQRGGRYFIEPAGGLAASVSGLESEIIDEDEEGGPGLEDAAAGSGDLAGGGVGAAGTKTKRKGKPAADEWILL
jgi:hypothetical protein